MRTEDTPPLLDLSALWAMESDFESAAPVRGFVLDFVSIWGQRYSRLLEALAKGNVEPARVAILSIKASSVMLGAARLSSVAEAIELDLSEDHPAVSDESLDALADCGARTIHQLITEYLRPAP